MALIYNKKVSTSFATLHKGEGGGIWGTQHNRVGGNPDSSMEGGMVDDNLYNSKFLTSLLLPLCYLLTKNQKMS